MGFLDRAKEAAQRAKSGARVAREQGQQRLEDLQARRQAEVLLREVGLASYEEHRGEGGHEAVVRAVARLDEHVRAHNIDLSTSGIRGYLRTATGSPTGDTDGTPDADAKTADAPAEDQPPADEPSADAETKPDEPPADPEPGPAAEAKPDDAKDTTDAGTASAARKTTATKTATAKATKKPTAKKTAAKKTGAAKKTAAKKTTSKKTAQPPLDDA